MKKIILGLFVFGLTIQSFAQEIDNLEVHIAPASYKYIDKVAEDNAKVSPAEPVKLLQKRPAIFNLENSKYYEDEYENYFLSFYIPKGKILASYDAEGNILRTIEKLKNTEIPSVVAKAVVDKFPDWSVSENVYLVNFHDENKVIRKEYKLLLERGNQRRKVKTDKNGNFL